MADGNVNTSIYPQAQPLNLLQTYGEAAQIRNTLIQNQRQQVGLSSDKIDLAHKGYGWLSQGLGSLAQDPRIATPEGPGMLQQFTAQAVQQGWITPDIAQSELQNMPKDPAQLPRYLQDLNVRVQDAANQFGQIYGTPGTIDRGSDILPVTSSSISGIRPIAAPIQKTLTPQDNAHLVDGTNAAGQPTVTPLGSVLEKAGLNRMTAQPQTAPSGPANRLAPYDQNNPAPQQAAQSGSVVTGASPGALEARKNVGAASGAQLAADTAQEANFQAEVTPLEKARDALIQLGPTGTGPGAEKWNDWKSLAVTLGIADPDASKLFDEANKYLTQGAQSGNPNTNDKLAAAFAGNPSVHISNAAAVDVLKTSLSLRRLQNAKVQAFNALVASGNQQPDNYNQWASKFNSNQDPVAYGFDMMAPDQRNKYVQGLSKEGKARFVDSLRTATQLGLISPPQAQPAAPASGN